MIRVFVCLFIFLSCSRFSAAQMLPDRGRLDRSPIPSLGSSLHGTIVHPPGTTVGNLFVEVYDTSGNGGLVGRTVVSSTGEFSFEDVPNGVLDIRVTDISGNVLTTQTVNSYAEFGAVQIRLPELKLARPISGVVSLAELQHKVPPKALKEAGEADKALRKHNMDSVVAHLQKALTIDPKFIAARRNLGLAYLQTQHDEEAVQQFQQLLNDDPRSTLAYSAMSSAYFDLHRYADSEAAARRTLDIDGASDLGHLFLGLSLTAQEKDDAEALKHLGIIANHYPKAHIAEAEILARQGDKAEAKQHLQAYLDSGEKESRIAAQAKAWLRALD